jgi:hypothetical protein
MRANCFPLAIAMLVVSTAPGQTAAEGTVERVFQFAHINTDVGFQRLGNTIRAIANVSQISLNAQAKTLTVRGTASQMSLSEWLFRSLDRAAGSAPAGAKLEYTVSGSSDELVRVLFLTHSTTPQDVQEIINAVRSVVEVQRMIASEVPGPLVMRGTVAQVSTAEWLVQALDRPANAGPFVPASQTLSAPEFASLGSGVHVARVFHPAHLTSPMQLQESVNMIRSLAEIQRAVGYNRTGAVIVRAESDQVALAGWLLNALAKPPTEEAPLLKPPYNSFVTRMFYFADPAAPQGLPEIVKSIRSRTNLQRVASYTSLAIAVRGTFDQVAAAERLVKEMNAIIAP